MARTNVLVAKPLNPGGGGSQYLVETNSGALYCFFIDTASSDILYRKSTDGGLSWAAAVTLFSLAGTTTQLSIWYDRWSGISAGLIHVVACDTSSDDVQYRSIDTESSDSLSSTTVVFAGASAITGAGSISVCRARGGNLYCVYDIDGGTEHGFSRSTDVGGTWGARTSPTEGAAGDYYILVPGWAADNQDMMLFFWDADADEISRKLYDDSANSWAETSIATSMVELAVGTGFPNFAATVDITNSRNLLVAWSAADLLNADLRCWHVTESAITEVTNVVANSTDDQGLCAIGIDTDTEDWYAFYCGKTDGSETFASALKIYYKKSTDDGATWGSETELTDFGAIAITGICCAPRFTSNFGVQYQSGLQYIAVNVEIPTPPVGKLTLAARGSPY